MSTYGFQPIVAAAAGHHPVRMNSRSHPAPPVRVAIVDDVPVFRRILRSALERQPGLSVVAEAENGCKAIELAERHRPDVILMDISMPVLNGIEATRVIHRHHPDIRIIGLSLYSEEERAREMLEAGAAYYMTKSGPATDLKAAIRACMRDRAAPARRMAS